ncbi:hypothetical protein PU634_10385 [Oceanimonas pelagia]|uniref:Uncharacterized protein n=1 Tax=Oceanimonas pelagia TaxID=3028314 RepID=A0AA50KL51_9GAMM|nr:hypothetical protein [Oceanimonas pelagia]WMC09523.1 hypothetical protein PU634_10385 [Oceanimonas pelagia]
MFYPRLSEPVTLDSLKLIRRHLQEDPEYLDHPSCPYSAELAEFLKEILPERKNPLEEISTETEPANDIEPEDVDIETESRRLYHEMRGFLKGIEKSDVSERAAMFRTCTALLEKLITIQERAQGVNQYMGFKRLMFEAMDEYLTPSERTELMERLEKEL